MPKQTLSLIPDAPIEGIDSSKFFQTPNCMAMKAIRSKLTGADWAVWTFLQMLDPHGDRLKDIPNPQEIGELVDLSAKQVKRSLAKLEEMGFYETEIVTLRGRNLAGKAVKEMRTTLTNTDKVVEIETKLSSQGQSCSKKDRAVQKKTKLSDSRAETYTPRDFSPSNTLTYSNQTNQTLSEAARERNLAVWKNLEESDRREIRCYARSIAIPKLPIKPTLEENWIASHCDELSNQLQRDVEFQKSYYELQKSYRDKQSRNSPAVENQQLTVEDLQRMYGANWKAAAAHFGIEVEEEIW